jgi:hypothetical protein
MAEPVKDKLAPIKARIEKQNGTVVENVSGEMELDDTDANGQPRKGPVLVLKSIEPGSQLKLAHPRPVIVLGSISGQVFGAYTVKAGNLLSGRLEGARHVEIMHKLGSIGDTNEDSWIVFDVTSDPGFFAKAQHSLDKLEVLEREQQPQREANARMILMRSVKSATFELKIYITGPNKELKPVFTVRPNNKKNEVDLNLKDLLRYLIGKTGSQGSDLNLVERFKNALNETITESLRLSSKGGIGAALRQSLGADAYEPYVESVYDYLLPKLISLWFEMTRHYTQQVVDHLCAAPMVLDVKGQTAPFYQFEYPHWKFHVSGSKIVPEKVADCNVSCQLGDDDENMRMTYTYVSEEDSFTQTKDFSYSQMRNRSMILKEGSIYLSGDDTPVFGPELEQAAE